MLLLQDIIEYIKINNIMSNPITDCLDRLNAMLSSINSLILRIQELPNETKGIFIAKRISEEQKLNEFWLLNPDTVNVVYNTDTHRNVEVTITGAGIHGRQQAEDENRPIMAGETWEISGDYVTAASYWSSAYFIEIGTHEIEWDEATGCSITVKSVVGMGTTKFEDDPSYMEEVAADSNDIDIIRGAARAIGHRGFQNVADFSLT